MTEDKCIDAETHDDDGDGVGNNTDEFPQDPDEQFDKDGDGVGDNADDFPDNKYASNWSTIYAAVGTLIVPQRFSHFR